MPGRASLYRWESIELEKVTEMVTRKVIAGVRQQLIQVYLKKGALVPVHAHAGEQMIYVLQGALRALLGSEEVTVREGEVVHIPSNLPHQWEALDDTFVIETGDDAR
jgi:quercetin dioxygenase-like cupin family protein